jgi:gas vesicle protein
MGAENLTIWQDADAERLRTQVIDAQSELADAEAAFAVEQRKVQALRALLFTCLRADYERRDRLRLIVRYREAFLDRLLKQNQDEADQVREQFARAEADTQREYESAATECATKKQLTPEEEQQLKKLWKKLVKLFHPDRVYDDAEKQATYQKLTQAINSAKERGDLDMLREIANDPDEFMRKQGWAVVEFAPEKDTQTLRRQLEMLQQRTAEVIASTQQLRRSADYELYRLWQQDPGVIDRVVRDQKEAIQAEYAALAVEAQQLRSRIEELSGEAALGTDGA